MDWLAVDSSSLSHIAYDPRGRLLDVEFRSGAVHRCVGVEPAAYVALMSAASKGRHLNAWIRDKYNCHRL